MKRIIILFFIFLLIPVAAFSQNCVYGTVMDEKGNGINEVQISLFQNGEIVALAQSNTNGEYRTGEIPQGKYHIVASCVGLTNQEDTVVINQDINLNFILKTSNIMLDSVVVMGTNSRATSKGHVFYLSKKAKECGNPFVALQEIPLLYSDPIDEKVSSSDGQSMVILIDGMRVNSGISPIDPSRIKSVEIIDVVGAKYIREGVRRVMNIKLKETSLYTYTQLSTRADYPAKCYFVGPKFEIGNSKISLYGDAYISSDHSRKENSYNLVTPMLNKRYTGESRGKTTDYDYSLMTKWRITGKDYFAVYVQGNVSKETSKSISCGEQNEYSISRDNISEYHSHLFSATAYYKHIFSEDEEMEAYAVYSDNRADNTSSLEENVNGNGGVNTQKYSNDRKLMTLTLDYSKDFDNGGSINIGNKTEYSYDRIENTGLGRYLFGHHRLTERIFAGYDGKLTRKLTYDVTAGMEYVNMKSDSISNNYFRPDLSLGMYYNITNNMNTHISYVYGNTSPSVAMLNPYNTSADTLLVSRGNPFLMPSRTHSFSWNASYHRGGFGISTSVSYGISSDIINSVNIAEDNGVLLTTYENRGRFRSLQMKYNMTLNVKGYFLMMYMSHNVNYYTTVGAKKHFYGTMLLAKNWGKFGARMSLTYQNYINTEFSRTKNYNPSSTLTLSYNITNDILLSIGCTSIIGNTRSKITVNTGAYKSVTYSTEKTFTPWILLRWSIRKNDKKKIDLDNEIILDHEDKIKL